jgi:hypothetical protein
MRATGVIFVSTLKGLSFNKFIFLFFNSSSVDDRYPRDQEEIYSHRMKAGKRTYFFDVKATRGQDYYLTITESKRRPGSDPDGPASYEKHKIFLYKEDFNKFIDALHDAVDYVREELLTAEEVAELDRPRPVFDPEQSPREDQQPPQPTPDLGDSTY